MKDHPTTTYDALAKNRWRTVWLMMLFPAMLITIVYLAVLGVNAFAYEQPDTILIESTRVFLNIAPFVTIGATLWIIIALLSGRRMVLAFAGAKPINKRDAPELYRTVENFAIQMGIPIPKIYIIDDMSMNAFATGYSPKNAAVAVTRGLLERLEKPELEAVMAHEIGHILHRDTRVMLVAVTMVGMIQLISELILRMIFRSMHYSSDREGKSSGNAVLIMILAGIVIWFIGFIGAMFVQLGISRRREFMADAKSAHITRHPSALVSALKKIAHDPRVEVLDGKRSIAAMCIADPLEKKKSFFDSLQGLFRTHPSLQDRVAALTAMDGA